MTTEYNKLRDQDFDLEYLEEALDHLKDAYRNQAMDAYEKNDFSKNTCECQFIKFKEDGEKGDLIYLCEEMVDVEELNDFKFCTDISNGSFLNVTVINNYDKSDRWDLEELIARKSYEDREQFYYDYDDE